MFYNCFMVILIAKFDLFLLISGLICVLLGGLIFLSIGIYRVKKDHAVIIEKINTYHKIIYSGWHYFLPIIYRRVGYYCIAPQQRKVTLDNGKQLTVTYQIEDVKLYHYNHISVENLLIKIRNENESINKEILESEFKKRGLIFLSLKDK